MREEREGKEDDQRQGEERNYSHIRKIGNMSVEKGSERERRKKTRKVRNKQQWLEVSKLMNKPYFSYQEITFRNFIYRG